jgi:hypothetical protein
MPGNGHLDAISARLDDGWWVAVDEGRLVFRHGASAIEVAPDGPLRWVRDGADLLSFEEAVSAVPARLHGWMALAALIGLRRCIGGLATGVALPAGYHEWPPMARRAAPVPDWMRSLARLDAVDMPDVPEGVDDGLSEFEDRRAG